MRGRIIKLPDGVANQIAAGEVVERPVAAAKELVENALDAGSTAIEIHFANGGKSLIRVSDNGSGMNAEEAQLALQRHATSKIRSVEDILRIGTFGFRGEALPSIASVSQFTLRTRTREETEGTEIRVDGLRPPVVTSCGMSPGTDVQVANLFHSVPARRKFLKTDQTEAAHIIQMSRLLAIAHPEVAFSLVEDGHEVFRSPICPDPLQRVREILGKRRADDFVPIEEEVEGVVLRGLVGRPGTGRSTRSEMITYVNRRPVESRLLSYALIESYHRYLPKGRYPLAFLFVEVPPEEVDVNVHPSKREVRFRHEPRLRGAVMHGLTRVLARESQKRHLSMERVAPISVPDAGASAAGFPAAAPTLSPVRDLRDAAVSGAPGPAAQSVPVAAPLPSIRSLPSLPERRENEEIQAQQEARIAHVRAARWRYCGVLKGRTGLFESVDGLILLNPRAARERVLYEAIQRSLAQAEIPRQALLLPAMLELSPLDAGVLTDQVAFFRGMGFEIEPFGRHVFRLREVPTWLTSEQPERFIEGLVQKIRERGMRPEELEGARTHVARLAALREARGYLPAKPDEWESLVAELLGCEIPLLDARGRPTFIEMRHQEIARKLMLDAADLDVKEL